MADQSSLKSSIHQNNPMSGPRNQTSLPTVLSQQNVSLQDVDCLKMQGRQHPGVKEELQEKKEWQKLLQEEAMQEDGNRLRAKNEAIQKNGLQENQRIEQSRNVNQSWGKEVQEFDVKGGEQERPQSSADVAARERFWEKGRAAKEKQLRELQLQQMEGRSARGVDHGGLGGEVWSDEESSWLRWLRALEEEKVRLTKLWRGGVIRDEEYMRRKRKLLDEKVEEETRSLEKLLIGGGIGVEEFQRRKGKLIEHKRLLESYQDGFPGDAVQKAINMGQGILENAREKSKQEEEEEFLRRQLNEKEKMMSSLWRDRFQMEEEFKLREEKLLVEQKNIEQARRQVEERPQYFPIRQESAAMRGDRVERQREEELKKKEKLLEEFRQERIEREKDLKIREQKLTEQKKLLESDQVRHQLEKVRKPSSSECWKKTEADYLSKRRESRGFDERAKRTNEASHTRVEKIKNKDAKVSNNSSHSRSSTRRSPSARIPKLTRRSRFRRRSSSRKASASKSRSASRRRSSSKKSASVMKPFTRWESAAEKLAASRRRSSSRLRIAPDGRCATPRFSARRSSNNTQARERSLSRERSASRKRRKIQQSISPRRSAPLRKDRTRSSSRSHHRPGSHQDGFIRVTLAKLPEEEEVIAHESSPVRRVALLSSPSRARSKSRESMFRVPGRTRLRSRTPAKSSRTHQHSDFPPRQRTPPVSRSRSRSSPKSRSRTSSKSRSRSRTPAKYRLGRRVPLRARLGLKRDVKSRLGARRRPDNGKMKERGMMQKKSLFSTVDQVKI